MNKPTAFVPDEHLYPAVLALFDGQPSGKILDAPAGQGAFTQALLQRGYTDIHCVDIIEPHQFGVQEANYLKHDVGYPLPYPDGYFDYVFSLEGIEHFDTPFTFIREICRVLKPGGKLYLSTPNTFSVDARLKYLVSGYFPRFRGLMQEPARVMEQTVDAAHISPIYFWQLHYFLLLGDVIIQRTSTNALLYKRQWLKRALEQWVASIIRKNIRKRGFPDHGVTSEAVLFGDCIIIEAVKRQSR